MRTLLSAVAVAAALAAPAVPAAADSPCFSFYFYEDRTPVPVGPFSRVVCVDPPE